MRVLMATFDAGGNVPPFLELGRELVGRGHDVQCVGQPSLRPVLEEAGVGYCALEEGVPYDPLEQMSIGDQVGAFGRVFFDDGYGADLRREIARHRPNALVIDSYLFGAMVASESSGIPFAVLVHTLWGWMQPLGNALLPAINECRARASLPAQSSTGIWSGAQRILVASTPLLDTPPPAELPNLRHVGPLFDERPGSADGSEPDGDSRPLALVGFSTTYMEQEGPLQRIVDALSGMPVRAVVTAGPAIDPGSVHASENVTVTRWLRHSTVMPSAAVVLTHGGHGIVSMALAYGKPLLCIPQGRDQAFIAERVESIGAGIAIAADSPPEALSEAVTSLLESQSYRVKAEEIAADMRRSGKGAQNAAVELEAMS
jgi:UDP:flavonoid glycosyltransferase YjiC (YdhE family)